MLCPLRFDVYGGRVHLHDIITCYLDLDSGLVSFQKNDEFLGTAYKLDKRSKDSAYLPHICTKNTEVSVVPPYYIFITCFFKGKHSVFKIYLRQVLRCFIAF